MTEKTPNIPGERMLTTLRSKMLVLVILLMSLTTIVRAKVSNTTRQRELLKNMTDGAFAVLDEFTALADAGILSEAEAQRRSVEWVNRFQYGQGQYFLACDMLLRGLAHRHEEMQGWADFRLKEARDGQGRHNLCAIDRRKSGVTPA